jgi:FOG: TPR repeat, SEL1 subfamily
MGNENLLPSAYDSLVDAASGGQPAASYAVAWCQLIGFGTERRESPALEHIQRLAEEGDPKACVHLAYYYTLYGDEEEAVVPLYRRAAEQGRADAMLCLASRLRDQDNYKEAARWFETAADTGNLDAIEEMLGIAEGKGDDRGMIKWLTVLSLRHPDPHVAYRSRIMIAMFMEEESSEKIADAVRLGEEWHNAHP